MIRQLFSKTTFFGVSVGVFLIIGLTSILLGHAPWDEEAVRAGGGDWVNYGTTFGERQPQSGSYQVGQTVSASWNALKPASEMDEEARPENVEITINRLTNIWGTDVSKGQAVFTDQDVADYAAAGFPNGGYEHALTRVGAQVSGDQNSSNWQLNFNWTATTPGYYQIDITPRTDQSQSLGWVAVRVEGAPVQNYATPYTTPYATPAYSYPTPAYSYPTPSYAYPSPSYAYPSPSYAYPSPSYAYPTPYYSYPTPSYSYPTPSYAYPAPSYSYPTPNYGGPTCPVSSTQARVARDSDWDTFKVINVGESIRVGGFHNNDLNNLAGDTKLDLTGPQNFTNIANGSRLTPTSAGDYILRVYHSGYSGSQCEAQAILRVLGATTTTPYPTPTVIITQAAPPTQPQVITQAAPSVLPKTGADVLLALPVLAGFLWVGRKIRKNFKLV